MNHSKLIMLGTGHAMATRCYNTCFILQSPSAMLMVDAGGGNGVLSQLEKARISLHGLHDLFVTHAHTDHLLGVVWMMRAVAQLLEKGEYQGTFRIYSHSKVLDTLDKICHMMLSAKDRARLDGTVRFCTLSDEDSFAVGDMGITCFDIGSTKEKQFGFRAVLPDGQAVVCLGDEPYNEKNRQMAEQADWLLCEAFCLYADRDVFHPYEKHHSTARDAGAQAQALHARHLLLYHTEDRALEQRKATYTAEAAQTFKGEIFVPDDLETIELRKG